MRPVFRAIGLTCLILPATWLLLSSPVPADSPSAPGDSPPAATRPALAAPAPCAAAFAPVREPRENEIVARKLETVVPAMDFRSTRFVDVVDSLRARGPFIVTVNWDTLAGADVDQETRVTVQLRDVKLKTALRTILQSIGALNDPLDYAVVDGTVRISTEADLARITEIRVYNCEDLIQRPMTADQRQVMESTVRERLIGSGHLHFEQALALVLDTLHKQAAQDLVGLIESNVEPGTWEPEGTIGSISEFGSLIVVRHNARAQEGVGELLTMLREAKGMRTDPKPAGGK